MRVFTGLIGLIALLLGPYAAALASAAWRLGACAAASWDLSGQRSRRRSANPPLTRWLADLIDELAGTTPDKPLTFGDLRSLPGPPDHRGVNLQMMTTNLSQGRPFRCPSKRGRKSG